MTLPIQQTLWIVTLLVFSSSLALGKTMKADLVFHNAAVYTANSKTPFAEAVAVKDGKIVFVGKDDKVESYIGKSTETHDLRGKLLLPGFIDNHNHVFEAASEAGGSCLLSLEASLQKQRSYLKKCKRNSKPGEWLTGWGFSIESLISEDDEQSPLEVIDEIFPDRPVVIMEQTSHSMWVNSLALKEVGFTKKTPHPQGGRILKDDENYDAIFGILYDNAGDIVMEKAWNSLKNKSQASYDGLLTGLRLCAENGITTIGDGRMYWKRGWYEVWKRAEKEGEVTSRVSLRPWVYPEGDDQKQLKFFKKIFNESEDSLLIVNQVKMYSDGILINNTAKVIKPYIYNRFPGTPYGLNYIGQEKMAWWFSELDKIGYGAHIHTIGDGGVRETLNAIEAARKKGSERAYTLTHLEMVNQKDIGRFAKLNVTADYQFGGDFAIEEDHSSVTFYVGKKIHHIFPMRRIFDTGANITLSSDWNVNPLSPLASIYNTTVIGKRGMPDVLSAIDAYTINAAESLELDDITGSIEVGKSADFVMLDRNITKGNPRDIEKAVLLMTMLQGEVVFDYQEKDQGNEEWDD